MLSCHEQQVLLICPDVPTYYVYSFSVRNCGLQTKVRRQCRIKSLRPGDLGGADILTLTHEEVMVMAVAASRLQIVAVIIEEWMGSLAARPGEEAFVAAMRREAAKADDARSALARYRATASSLPSAPGVQMEQDNLPAQAID